MFRKGSILVALAIFGSAMSFPTDSDTSETYENYPEGIRNDNERPVTIETLETDQGTESSETTSGSHIVFDKKQRLVKAMNDDLSVVHKTVDTSSSDPPAGLNKHSLNAVMDNVEKCKEQIVDNGDTDVKNIASCLFDVGLSIGNIFLG